MGLVWRRRWWRFLIGGINRPLIFMAIFAWNLGDSAATAAGGYLGFLVPGLVVMAAVSAGYSDLVNWFTLRRTYYRVLDEYLLAPISNTSLLIGHVLGAAGKGFVLALLVFLAARFFVDGFFVPPLFLVQLFVVCLTFACLAVAVAMVAGGDKDTLMFTNLIVFPMTFFCGTFFPVEQLPGPLALLSRCLAPVGDLSLCMGYTLAGAVRGLLAGLIVLAMVFLLMPALRLNWAFFLAMLLSSLCFGALGVLIGLWLRSFDDQTLVSEFILVPMTFLSGTLIPVERLPVFLQHCVWLFPLTPATQLLRSTLTAAGAGAGQAALVGGWALVLFLLGWWRLKKM